MTASRSLWLAPREFLAVAVVSLSVIGFVRPADACGSVMWREHIQTTEQRYIALVDEAESAEQLGATELAQRMLKRAFADSAFASAPATVVARAHRTAARVAMSKGQYATAEKHFAIAVKTLPELTGQYARAMVKAGHFAEARKELAVWEHRGVGDAFGWMATAEVLRLDGDKPGALMAVDRALKLLPHDASARKLRVEIEGIAGPAVAVASADTKTP